MAVSSTTGGLRTGVCLSTDRPQNPYNGQVIYETDTNRALVWDNSAWVVIADASTTGFPTSLDTGTVGAIEALQAKVGVDGSAVTGSLDYKVSQLEDGATGGKILQVVSTTKTDTFSAATDNDGTPNAQWASVTGLTASITPSSATSKVLVLVSLFGTDQNDAGPAFRLTRNGTEIGVADAAGNRNQASGVVTPNGNSSFMGAGSVSYLDSPASTSALTYGVDVANVVSSGFYSITIYVNRTQDDGDQANRPRATSTITLMEVAA